MAKKTQTVAYTTEDEVFIEDYSKTPEELIKHLTQFGDPIEDGTVVVEIRRIGTLKTAPAVLVLDSAKGKK